MAEWMTTPAFTERANALMRDFRIPGFSVAVLHGDIVHTRSFGYATFESKKLVDSNTIFDVASCSKALTGVAMGILVDSHPKLSTLGWKTPIANLTGNDFVMHRFEDTPVITIEHLLSHTSGFSGHEMSVLGVNAVHPDNVLSVTRNLRNLPSTARPGEKYQYSNIMYAVATHIIEVLSGQSFSAFLHENVFKPLNMESTFLQPSEVHTAELDSHFATPYYYANDKYHQADRQETPEFQGAGSIQTTPSDYLRFIAAMLKHDKLPVTESIYEARNTLTVPVNDYCGTFYNAGYHEIVIQLQNHDLVINAADRSEPFTMTLEHVKNNREFRGYITANDGAGEDEVHVEFRLDAENNVTTVGLKWEPALGSKYLFWHDKIS